jgi:hypothetical protein
MKKRPWQPGDLARMKEDGEVWEDAPIIGLEPARSRMVQVNEGDMVLVVSAGFDGEERILRVMRHGRRLLVWSEDLERVKV